MSKARNIADIGSHDVIETDSDGVTITGVVQSSNISATGALGGPNGFTATQIDDIFRAAMQV